MDISVSVADAQMIGEQVICRSCGEPWDFSKEISDKSFVDFFNAEDCRELDIPDGYLDSILAGESSSLLRGFVASTIIRSGRCFSCGFSASYQQSYGAQLKVGDHIVNYGTIYSIDKDPPDPNVGLFSGQVEVFFDATGSHYQVFSWDETVVIHRKKQEYSGG